MKLAPFYFLALLIAFSATSCNKDDDDEEPMEDPLTLTTLCSYDILIGANSYKDGATLTNNVTCGITSASNEVYGAYAGDFDGAYGFSVQRGTFENATGFEVPENDVFAAAFDLGEYPLTKDAENGFEIRYEAEDGTDWSTSYGDADQSSSKFTITEVISGEIIGSHVVKTRGTFQCTFYTETGESAEGSGTFTLSFQNF